MSYHNYEKNHVTMVFCLWVITGFLGLHRIADKRFISGLLQLLICAGSFFVAARAFLLGIDGDSGFMLYLLAYLVLFGANLIWWVIDYAIMIKPMQARAH